MISKKKTIAMLIMICNLLLVMTGCENQIPEMTEEQNALVTEYAAGLLLNYHADHDGRLVDTSLPPEEDPIVHEPVEEMVVPDGSTETEETDVTVSSNTTSEVEKPTLTIEQILEVNGFEVKYRGYEVCDSYPDAESAAEDMFFSMKAGAGNKLLVLKLDVVNTTAQEMMFDTLSMTDLSSKVIINGSDKQSAYISMLENDFMAIHRTFAGGEVYEAAIITEMPESKAMAIESVELQLKKGERATSVKVTE